MAYKSISYGFDVGGPDYIDRRLLLTKEQMKEAYDEWFMPPVYIAYCLDDRQWYEYNEENEEDPETGFYRPIPSGIVKDVRIEGVSILDSEGIADFEFPVEDVLVDGASVVENKKAQIDLSGLQKKLKDGPGIKVDSEGKVSIDNEVVPTKDELPELIEELGSEAGFVTKSVINLENYYLKSETYTQQEIEDLIGAVSAGIKMEFYSSREAFPVTGEANTIYFARRSLDSQIYDQYVWLNNDYRSIGSLEINLDDYYKKTEVDALLAQKQNALTAGSGISIVGNTISADVADLPDATSSQKGVIKYDNDTIKKNAEGQLYVAGGGGGEEYTAGPGIRINNANVISAKVDDETIFTNQYGELYMEAIPIDAGDGVQIKNGTISIVPNEVKDAIELQNYQKKLIAGSNITIDPTTNVISSTGGGSGGGANWGEIGGTLSSQGDLWAALQNKANVSQIPTNVSQLTNDVPFATQSALNNMGLTKQDKLTAGANITISADNVISATGGEGPTEINWTDIKGNPLSNADLANEIAQAKTQPVVNNGSFTFKANGNSVGGGTVNQVGSTSFGITLQKNGSAIAPSVSSGNATYNIEVPEQVVPGNGVLTITQDGNQLGTFSANQSANKTIDIPSGGIPGNGQIDIQKNGVSQGMFTVNQNSNTSVNIKVPTFSLNGTVLTIIDNGD